MTTDRTLAETPRTHCAHGHVLNPLNWRPVTRSNGRRYYRCLVCHAHRMRMKYRNDDAWREIQKTRTRNNHRAAAEGVPT